ncbi:MAG: nuclease-related domain-containing protein [Alphaproteobacteria bacterium]|nr:nuclease-related domain-containing protein [Alphaproteobacteria bacterium]
MRRFAGSWVRGHALSRLHVLMVLCGIGIGFAIHTILSFAALPFLGARAVYWLSIALMILALPFLLLAWRSVERGRIAGWLKGADSERKVGQEIERALTAPGCAVAHSVTELTAAGDIDHLVATPAGLWVVEVKHRRVPRKRFPKILAGIARKVKEARAWAPPDTPVRGCLVLDNPEGTRRRRYEKAGEPIAVHTAGSLAKALAAEAASGPSTSFGLMEAVWRLGKAGE